MQKKRLPQTCETAAFLLNANSCYSTTTRCTCRPLAVVQSSTSYPFCFAYDIAAESGKMVGLAGSYPNLGVSRTPHLRT
jgi:hypothetical protein